jgi:hypothetical protein
MEVIMRRKLRGSPEDFVILKYLMLAQNKGYWLRNLKARSHDEMLRGATISELSIQ